MRKILSYFLVGAALNATPVQADIEAGLAAIETGQFREALTFLEPDLTSEQAFDAHWLTGRAYRALGERKKALRYFEKAVKMAPSHIDAQYWWGLTNCEIVDGGGFFSAGDLIKKCKKALEYVVENDAEHIASREFLVQLYAYMPGFLGGDKGRAIELADELLKIDKATGLNSWAEIYQAKNKYEKAFELYEQVLELDPDNQDALYNRGLLFRERKNLDAALRDFERLIESDADDRATAYTAALMLSEGRYFFGAVTSRSGIRSEEGIKVLEEYLDTGVFEEAAREGYAQVYLGNLYLAKGDTVRARALANSARKFREEGGLKKRIRKLFRAIGKVEKKAKRRG